MKKALIVDHGFHRKTKSFSYMEKVLKDHYQLEFLYDDSYLGKDPLTHKDLNKQKADVIIFFQVLLPANELKLLKCQNIVWIPMWDSEVGSSYQRWASYQQLPIKIICHSKVLKEIATVFTFDSYYTQVFCQPQKRIIDRTRNKYRVFYWYRSSKLNWQVVKKNLPAESIESIYFLHQPDPQNVDSLPSKADIQQYHIDLHQEWMTPIQIKQQLQKTDLYICPRLHEGIGFSLLEALAFGCCLIGFNAPTMSEYITDKKTGYLFNLNKEDHFDLAYTQDYQIESIKFARLGYQKWQADQTELLNFVARPGISSHNTNIISKLKQRIDYYLIKKL